MTRRTALNPVTLLLAEEVWGSTLHAIRSLSGRGSEVLVAVAGEGASIYRSSRGCTRSVDVPHGDATATCSAVIHWVERVVEPARPVLVLPLSDRMVEYLHLNRDRFGDRYTLGVPEPALTRRLLDKEPSLALAESAGLSVPEWVAIRDRSDLSRIDRLRPPVALRPTKWSTVGRSYFKIAVERSHEGARRAAERALEDGGAVIAQEFREAPDDHVEFAIVWRSSDGSRTAVCTGRKCRQAGAEGGVMIWGVTTAIPDVHEATVAFLDHSGFTGLGGIEFIRGASGIEFIEFNPRLEAIHFISTAAGVDTVALAYDEVAAVGPTDAPTPTSGSAAWIGSAWISRVMSDPTYRADALRDRLRFARATNKVTAVWSAADPVPGLLVVLRLLRNGIRSVRRRATGRTDRGSSR